MIRGSCLCGGVKFEVRGSKGPFELCHCNRCRKATGSAFAAALRAAKISAWFKVKNSSRHLRRRSSMPRRPIGIASVVVAVHPYRCHRTTHRGLRFRRAPLMMIQRYDRTNTFM